MSLLILHMAGDLSMLKRSNSGYIVLGHHLDPSAGNTEEIRYEQQR